MRINDHNFIKLLKKKDEDALYYVVDKYHGLIKGICFKVLNPLKKDGIIDECINDVYLKIWENSEKFKGDSNNFKNWIGAIARYRALDYYRTYVNKNQISLSEFEETVGIELEDDFIKLEDKKEILECINYLGRPDSEIFLMKYFLGYKSEEIANRLSITKASVNNRISRGKKKLKDKLEIREIV